VLRRVAGWVVVVEERERVVATRAGGSGPK
jgi:hypothetical protein